MLKSGPVHLNIQFDEPLVSAEKTDWLAGLRVTPRSYDNQVNGKLESTTGVLVVGHDRAGYTVSEITEFADKLGWPVIAEDPLSFPQAVAHTALFLSDPKISEILAAQNVVVIGRTTLSRSTNNFIKLAKNLIVIDPRTKDIDSKREGNLILSQLPNEVVSQKNDAPDWQIASDLSASIISELEWSEQLAIVNICKSIPTQSALFIGSSRPVRDVEAFCKPRSGVQVLANRGLAGIDGNISTVFGIATEFESTYAILGDLTFLHDISALTNRTDQNVRIYVINNNGGGIFSTLTHRGSDGFESIFGTPHNLDLAAIASALNIKTSSINSVDQLNKELAQPIDGVRIVIAQMPDRESNSDLLKQVHSSLQKI